MSQDTSSCEICGKKATADKLTKCKACGKNYCAKCQSPSSNQNFCLECVNVGGVIKH